MSSWRCDRWHLHSLTFVKHYAIPSDSMQYTLIATESSGHRCVGSKDNVVLEELSYAGLSAMAVVAIK